MFDIQQLQLKFAAERNTCMAKRIPEVFDKSCWDETLSKCRDKIRKNHRSGNVDIFPF